MLSSCFSHLSSLLTSLLTVCCILIAQIFSAYISEDSAETINVDHRTRLELTEAIRSGKVTPTIFDKAVQEVVQMIQENWFRKFLGSEYCDQMVGVVSVCPF